jgi:hypothetical protein
MRSAYVALVGLAVLTFAVDAEATVRGASGLEGVVMKGPTRPVCLDNDPCEAAAASVRLQFSRDGKVVAEVTTTRAGRYSVRLKPGAYTVRAPGRRIGVGLTPRVVRVPRGRIGKLDFHLDSGIQ